MPTSTDYTAVLWSTRDKLYDAIVLKSPFFKRINSKTNKDVAKGADGRWYIEWLVNVAIGSGTLTVPEGSTLPTPVSTTPILAKLPLKTIARTISISAELNASGQITGSDTALKNEVNKAKDDFALYLEHVLWGDGSGIISTVKSDAASDNIFIASSCRFLRVGLKFDTINLGTGAKDFDGRTITAINYNTHEVTFDGAAAQTTAGYGICHTGMYGIETPGYLAIANDNGLIGATDYKDWFVTKGTQTYAGVDRAVYTDFKATVIRGATPGTPEAFGEGKMLLALAQAQANWKETEGIGVIYCDPGMAYTLAKACPQNVQVPNLTKEMGWEGPIHYINPLDNKRLEVISMKTAPPHSFLFCTEDDLSVRWTGRPDWFSNNGKILEWQGNMPNGTNTFRGTYLALLTLIGHNPSTHVILTDIAYHADITSYYPL